MMHRGSTIDPILESVMDQLGSKYRLKQHALHMIASVLAGLHMLSLTFVAPTPPHRCLIEGFDLNTSSSVSQIEHAKFNSSLLERFIPLKEDGRVDSCHKYQNAFENNDTYVISSCDGQYVYDKSIYAQSRVYDWNMVCENKWQRALIQSVYVFGVFNGALICGALADRFGRKPVLCLSAVFQFTFALLGGFITHFPLYCVILFLYGFFGSGGAYVTSFVLSMELVHKKNRTYCGAVFSACFAIGMCLNALWGYLIRDVRMLQTVIALHALLLFGHYWLVDESIRWLYGQGRWLDALQIVRKACKANGTKLSPIFDIAENDTDFATVPLQGPKKTSTSHGFSDLFRGPILRFRAITAAFVWFSTALCFYGLAFNTGGLPGNPYLVFFLVAAADLPGHLLVALVVDITGRRALNSALLLIGGVACVVTTFIPRGLVVTTIAMIAKIALAGCFAVMYNYTAELFPTVVRNSAVGLCSMAARMGGMLTPQITLLDSLDKRIPPLIFGAFALIASCLTLFLPETLRKDLPQTLEDGEYFGQGDTAFASFYRRKATPAPLPPFDLHPNNDDTVNLKETQMLRSNFFKKKNPSART